MSFYYPQKLNLILNANLISKSIKSEIMKTKILINNKRKDEPKILQKTHTMPRGNRKMCLSASATVEASFVIPIFIYAVMSVMYFLQIIGAQVKIEEVLYKEARTISKYAYAYDKVPTQNRNAFEDGFDTVAITAYFITKLGNDNISKLHIVGGVLGIDMSQSQIMKEGNAVNLVVSYHIKNPFDIFGLKILDFTQCASTKAWVGTDREDDGPEENEGDELVYITPNGSVYHKSKNCSYLNLSIRHISQYEIENARNADGGKYYACEKCGDADKSGGVYITDYGNRYHTDKNCSRIKRNILAVKKSSVTDRTPCSKCAQ